jgi:hypothetical protein
MFWALHAHPQEVLHKWHLVYCVRVVSVGCTILVQPTDITCTQYTKFHLFYASWGWASNAQNMYRPWILNKLNEKCITLVSLYWYTKMHSQQNIKFDTLCIICLFCYYTSTWFGLASCLTSGGNNVYYVLVDCQLASRQSTKLYYTYHLLLMYIVTWWATS